MRTRSAACGRREAIGLRLPAQGLEPKLSRLVGSSRPPLLLLSFLLALACAHPSEPKEGHPVLTGIDFVGNKRMPTGDLEKHIATEPWSGFFGKTPRYYDEDLFEIDKKRIERYYQSKGFFEAKVDGVDVIKDGQGRVSLKVHLTEGPRATISNFSIEGLDKLDQHERKSVTDDSGLRVGTGFDEELYEKGKLQTVAALRERGFAEAKVDGKVKIFPVEGRATIVLQAETGLRYHFGKVLVSGNRAIPSEAIARATGIDRGDLYKPSALELAQQRVYNLGTFAGARVGLEPLPGGSAVAPVRVSVREADFQTVRFGIGFQVETERYEVPKLRAEYTNRNLFGGLRRLEVVTQGGYAFTPSIFDVQKTGPTLSTSVQLTTPNVFIPSLDFIARGEYAREVQLSFDYQRVAARFSLVYRYLRHTIQPALNFVRYFAVQVPEQQLENGLVVGGSQSSSAQPSLLRDSCTSACTLTYPELRYTYDARDSILEPTRGFYFTTDFQQTLKPGAFTYFKVEPEIRGYLSVGKSLVLAGRADFGAILLPAGAKSPATERFFGGGANSNRGYSSNGQGPKYGANPTGFYPARSPADQFGGTYTLAVPRGGNGLLLLSGELRVHTDFALTHSAIVFFLDASRVTADAQLPWESGLEYAPGIGLRYITPFGPIRVDVGYLINPANQVAFNQEQSVLAPLVTQPTLVSAYCRGAGCISESRWTYHISLGEAF